MLTLPTSKFKSEKKKKEKLRETDDISTPHAHLQHLKDIKKKCRKVAPTKFSHISSTDRHTDRQAYFDIVSFQRRQKNVPALVLQYVPSDYEVLYVCKEWKIIRSTRI